MSKRDYVCKLMHIKEQVRAMVKDQILNSELAKPIYNTQSHLETDAKFKNMFTAYRRKKYSVKSRAAKHAFIPIFFLLFLLHEALFTDDSHYIAKSLFFLFLFTASMHFLKKVIGYNPMEAIGTRFFLDSETSKHLAKVRKYDAVQTFANHRGVLSPWRLIWSDKQLEEAMSDLDMHVMEHEVMLCALYAIKYEVFDCLAISAITMLKLVEAKIPLRLERFGRNKGDCYGHNFIVVNRAEKSDSNDIKTWNDDSYILCPWYNVCKSAADIKKDPKFFLEYPLFRVTNIEVIADIQGDKPPKAYKIYLNKLNDTLEQYSKGLQINAYNI